VFSAHRRFLLFRGSNTIRTCVQGFSALRAAGKPLTWGDGNLRVQERRSAAERGITACCLARELPLATSNIKDYADFGEHEGLELVH
jgi:hypothetical protein